jgi:hypothetical protein
VLSRASKQRGVVEGYDISSGDRGFDTGDVSGRGRFDYEFTGQYREGTGYTETESTTRLDTSFLRLGAGNTYANGNAHLKQTVTTERLNAAEAFGLGLEK